LRVARNERGIWQAGSGNIWYVTKRITRAASSIVISTRSSPASSRASSNWPHSSFHRDVCTGIFSLDWAGDGETSG